MTPKLRSLLPLFNLPTIYTNVKIQINNSCGFFLGTIKGMHLLQNKYNYFLFTPYLRKATLLFFHYENINVYTVGINKWRDKYQLQSLKDCNCPWIIIIIIIFMALPPHQHIGPCFSSLYLWIEKEKVCFWSGISKWTCLI